MTCLPHARARWLAAVLALSMLPISVMSAIAEDTPPAVHPWKQAYARRIANEGLESRKERDEKRKLALREQKRARRERAQAERAAGLHARRVPPTGADNETVPAPLTRLPRRFGVTTFTPPANVIVNNRAGDPAAATQSETSVAAFGDVLVAAWNDGGLSLDSQGWATSADGGVTWVDRGDVPHPPITNFIWTSDPSLAVNEKTGAFYYSGLCEFTDSNPGVRAGIAVVKGRWNGTTVVWGTPVVVRETPASGGDFADKNWCVADSVSGRVYLSYTFFSGGVNAILFQWADSNAVTWSTPGRISLDTPAENGFVQGSRPVVDGDGTLYVVYELTGQSFEDFYRIRRSTDRGVSFTFPVTAVTMFTNFGTGPPGYNRPFGVQFCGIAVDRSHGPNRGRVYLSWAESINWLDEVSKLGTAGDKSEVESNNVPATATPVTLGQTLRGTSSPNDPDDYALPLLQGQQVVVAADSAAATTYDLRLFARDGVTNLTYTTFDNGVNPTAQQPEGFPSGWMFTAPHDGTYYLQVRSLGQAGPYRVRTGLVHRDTERGRDQRDIFVGYSDNGTTWVEPVRLSEDPIGFDSFLPEVAVAPDGGVYAAWYDYRDAPAATDGGLSSVYLAHSGDGGVTWTTLGALADSLSNWTTAAWDLIPNQGDYITLTATSSYVWSLWGDSRRGNSDVFSARAPLIPNGTQVAFADVHLNEERITIDWLATPADTLTMRLYRATDGGPFQYLDVVQFDPAGALTYVDSTVVGNHGYAYRLGRFTNGIELFYGHVSVFLPSSFALRLAPPRPNPITGSSFAADFILGSDGPADLFLVDISGREVMRLSVNLPKGSHTVTLPVSHSIKPGLYVLTLRQGGHNSSTRAYIVR